MNYTIRFFDIINCIILGAISIIIVLITWNAISPSAPIMHLKEIFNCHQKIIIEFKYGIMVLITLIVYTTGLVINSFIDVTSWAYADINHNTRKISKKNYLLEKIMFNSIYKTCYDIKTEKVNRNNANLNYPAWIYYSNNPYKVLATLIERISQKKDENVLNEYRYMNEFFCGIYSIIMLCSLLLMFFVAIHYFKALSFHNDVFILRNATEEAILSFNNHARITTNLLMYLFSGIMLCYAFSNLSKYYAKKLIKYISDCTVAHSIKIDDIIIENGTPIAYVLMKVNFKKDLENIKQSLTSIKNQDYPNIKLIIFIYGNDKDKETSFNLKTNNEFTQLMSAIDTYTKHDTSKDAYCIEAIKIIKESFNKAEAALGLRKAFVDIANCDDVAIFLDPKDEFDNNRTVSTIIQKFAITNADICLLNFIETENTAYSLIRNDKKLYVKILEELENNVQTFSPSLQLHATSTLNCVKAYRRMALDEFIKIIDSFDNSLVKGNYDKIKFKDSESYASFIDFAIFLVPYIKITAIRKATHKYVQFFNKHDVTNEGDFNFFHPRITALCYIFDLIIFKYYDKSCKSDVKIDEEIFKYLAFKSCVITLFFPDFGFNEKIFLSMLNEKLLVSSQFYCCNKMFEKLKEAGLLNEKSTNEEPFNIELLTKCFEDVENKYFPEKLVNIDS